MRTQFIIAIVFLLAFQVEAQETSSVKVNLSSDTILLGNYFEICYSVENIQGDFKLPPLDDMELVSCYNFSSSRSMANGEVSSKHNYCFNIMPVKEGTFTFGEAKLKTEEEEIRSDKVVITVLPNPNGTRVVPEFNFPGDKMEPQSNKIQPKKKRKLKKI